MTVVLVSNFVTISVLPMSSDSDRDASAVWGRPLVYCVGSRQSVGHAVLCSVQGTKRADA